jgi:hypothetical protein
MASMLDWLDAHPNIATWIGSVGTLIAVVVAVLAIYFQQRHALVAEGQKRAAEEASTLLSLKFIASEIRRMITLSGFQIDAVGNAIIYPDIAAEFAAMAGMLDQLSVDRIASRGCIPNWLLLRRIATEMSILFRPAPAQGDGFYLSHRTRIAELGTTCSKAAAEIGCALKLYAPDLYAEHKQSLECL